jgi:hypothetical protein
VACKRAWATAPASVGPTTMAVSLVVWVRNVGKEEVKFHYPYPCIENPLTVTDGAGKPVSQPQVIKSLGQRLPLEVNLAPGKAIVLHELKRQLKPASESGNKSDSTLYGTGKVSVQYERVLGETSSGSFKPDPNLSKLSTGKLELEINPEQALNQAQPGEAPLEDPKVVEAIEAAGGKVYFFKEKEHSTARE